MANESRNNFSTSSQTQPDALAEFVRRLRDHARAIKNPAATRTMGRDMFAAALVIEQQLIFRVLNADMLVGELLPNEAMALAAFLKRLRYEDCAKLASPFATYDGVSEADTIWTSVLILQRGLADAGFPPPR